MNLIEAILKKDIERIKELLAKGGNPNLCEDDAGITPMHFVAQQNVLEAVPLFVQAGANLEAKTRGEGDTPLQIAQLHGHVQMVNLIAAYLTKTFGQGEQH